MVSAYVNELGQKIAAASQRPDIECSFSVLDSKTVNAFTVGGGQVFIYRGLMECMGSEAELAGIIAHEVGHIVGKHTAKGLTTQLIMAGIVSGGAELLGGDNEKRRAAIEEAGGVISFLRQAKYSRDDEREADFLAVYSLYRLGYDPAAINDAFETFRKLGGDPSQLEVYFQDHPAPAERIENTRTELPKLNLTGLRTDSAAFAAVKARLAELEYRC
ncbi:MAG: M48 family metalloprotease [bacterium]|nr:M48 family metalloprotease [bacterium]